MAQLKNTLIQGSARVTDTLYANNVNIASTTASLPLFTDTSKNIITKSIADTKTALGIAASANHADSYFVKAITSADNKIVRFDGSAGQIQTGPMTISDEGYIRSYNTTRWTMDWYIFHPGANKQVAEVYFDSGDPTNITTGKFYWLQYSPTSTASNTPTSYREVYGLPTVTKDLTENKSYDILTSKSAVTVAQGGTGATTAANARTNLGLGSAATYNISNGSYHSTNSLIPVVRGGDGVMEIGKYIDFHVDAASTKDYDARITASATGLALSGTTTGTFNGKLTTTRITQATITGSGTTGGDQGSSNTTTRYKPAVWTFNASITPTDGDEVTLKQPCAGHDYGTWLTLDNGNTYYPVVYGNGSRITTHFSNGVSLKLYFDDSGTASVFARGGAMSRTTATGVWRVLTMYDSNSNDTGYYHRRIYPNLKAGGPIHPYSIIMQLANGRWSGITTTAPTNPTSGTIAPVETGKAASTSEYMFGHVLVMYARSTYVDGNNIGTYNIWSAHTGLIDGRYSFNLANSSGNGFTAYAPIYLVGTVSNGLFKLDSTKWWTQTLPTSEDNKVYIYIGDAYDWYRLTFTEEHPTYWYKDGSIQLYTGYATTAGSAATLSGTLATSKINGVNTSSGSETTCLTAKGTWKTFGTSNLTLGSTAGAALSNTASAGSATTAAKSDHVHPLPTAADIGAAAGSHSHGNITSTGCITTAITIANGDYLIVGDNDKNGKIGKGPAFVSTTANKFLKDTGSFTTIAAADLPAATTSDKGAVIVGSGLAVSNGTISIDGINTSSGSTTKCLTEKGTWERKQLYYGTCETAAGTSLKEVICAEYDKVLTIGDMVVVKFTNTNSATTSGLQLTIKNTSSDTAGTAAANIKKQMNASVANLSQVGELRADTIAVFIYNGTYWILINCDYNSNNNVTQNIATTTDGLRPVLLSAYTRGTGITSASSTIRSQNVYVDTRNDNFYATAVHNAVWNDYAEYRRAKQPIAPGRVIIDTDEGAVVLATRRLQPGAQIVSDTWGHIMGETSDAKTPVAVAGRVLVYPYRDRNEYHAGMSVCSAPNGTVDIMSDEEIRNFSNCIIGYVSEIPNYETWGSGNVKVDGRIWVRVK